MKETQTYENFDWSLVELSDHKEKRIEKEQIVGFTASSYNRLILFGETGRGKTHLANSIVFDYRKKMNPQNKKSPYHGKCGWEINVKFADFIKVGKLYELFFDAQAHLESRDKARYSIKEILRTEVVAIDDLGGEKSTGAEIFPQGFIDFLDDFEGKLIITTNLVTDSLIDRYGEKIVSRLYHNTLIIGIDSIDKIDYRLRDLYRK